MSKVWIEQNCIIEHEGRSFESGGAIVTPEIIIAYLGKNSILTDWHGRQLGTYTITSTWRMPHSYISSTMHQVEAVVDGVVYTGRSGGVGLVYRGKRKRRS